jgi:hypothetical protein
MWLALKIELIIIHNRIKNFLLRRGGKEQSG